MMSQPLLARNAPPVAGTLAWVQRLRDRVTGPMFLAQW